MPRSSKPIDYIDLTIHVPDSAVPRFKQFFELFVEEYNHVEVTPRFKANKLHINSNDLIAFLGYVDPHRLSDFELERFRAEAMKELDQRLLRSLTLDHQAHYKWCMAAIKNFVVGRHLEEE